MKVCILFFFILSASFAYIPENLDLGSTKSNIFQLRLDHVRKENDELNVYLVTSSTGGIHENSVKTIRFFYVLKSNYSLQVKFEIRNQNIANLIGTNNFTLIPTASKNFTIVSINESIFYNTSSNYLNNSQIFLNVEGNFLGHTFIQMTLVDEVYGEILTNFKYSISVIRVVRVFDTIFTFLILCIVTTSNLIMGTKLKLSVVKEVLKKPVAPIIGFLCQYTIMPLVSFVVILLLKMEPSLALGYFGMGCAPGGGASNQYTYLLNGDVSLSITMTLISSLTAIGMVPLWMLTLGQFILNKNDISIKIPFQNMIMSLIIMIIPVGVGYFIKVKLPRVSKILAKLFTPLIVFFIIFGLSLGIYANLYIYKMFTPKMILAGCLLPYSGFILGGLVSFILRQSWSRVKTISIETGLQNPGVPIFLLKFSLPAPDSDLAVVGPIAAATFTPLPIWIWIGVNFIRKKYFSKAPQVTDAANVALNDEKIVEQL